MKGLILSHLEESIIKGGWHGPSLIDVVKGIEVSTALSRPLENRHSIWEIVQHVVYWIDRVNDVLKGEEHPPMGDPEDWKPVEGDSSAWDSIEEDIIGAYERLRDTIQETNEGKIRDRLPDTNFTYSWMLFGLVHHNLYHAGQIAIMK